METCSFVVLDVRWTVTTYGFVSLDVSWTVKLHGLVCLDVCWIVKSRGFVGLDIRWTVRTCVVVGLDDTLFCGSGHKLGPENRWFCVGQARFSDFPMEPLFSSPMQSNGSHLWLTKNGRGPLVFNR